MVMDPFVAFPVFLLHRNLAKESVRIVIFKDCCSVTECIDEAFGQRLTACVSKYKDADAAAAFRLMGSGGWSFLRELLHIDHPTIILDRVRDFYEEAKPSYLEFPFSAVEYHNLVRKVDEQAEHVGFRMYREEFVSARVPTARIQAAGRCVSALAEARLWSANGYAYLESLPSPGFRGYAWVFQKLMESLAKEDVRLFMELHKTSVADEALKLLLGQKVGSLSTLIGFEPLNPLKLLKNLPDPTEDMEKAIEMRKEIDKEILMIKKIKRRNRKNTILLLK